MKKNIPNQFHCTKMLFVAMLLFLADSLGIMAQTKTITGKVSSDKGENLSGVTILIKGTKKGTSTDKEGKFSLEATQGSTLVFSFIGFTTQEISIGNNNLVNVQLEETAKSLDEVVVTGLFDERKKLEASVSISTLNNKQMERLAPNSGAELLRNVPGIFVNSSAGEIRSNVYTRGLANRPSYNEDVSGLYYVSMQEDGLPVSNVFLSTYTHDLFLRTDATLNRLEAVRGGTASIAGANAPGGIFNYLSKTGSETFSGLIREKAGLEGDGKNLYTRTDINFGGPLQNGWTYNIGGFYRNAKGARDMGYQLNYGGQVKANLQKKYKDGSITFYAKYLNDHNGTFMNLLGKNFDHPELVSGISNTDAFALPASAKLSAKTGDGVAIGFDPTNLNHSKEIAFGLNWKHSFANGFSIQNNAKYSAKDYNYNITQATSPTTLSDLVPNAVAGTLGIGTITYKDNITKQTLAVVKSSFAPGPTWTVQSNTMPGQNIIQNGILYQAALTGNPKINEFFDQFVISKKTDKMSFNFGAFVGISDIARYSAGISGGSFTTLESQPRMLDISYVNVLAGGVTQQITSPEGYFKTGGLFGYNDYDYKKTNIAPFLASTWKITDKLTFDWGLRFEHTASSGTNYMRTPNDGKDGGLDGNALTTYDNNYYTNPTAISYNFSNDTWSYSGAFNYLISATQSIYGRYSVGKKAPEANLFSSLDTKEAVALANPVPQKISQVEIGYKLKTENVDIAVTPFYSLLSNIYTGFSSLDSDGKLYQLTPYYNSLESKGLEAEATITFSKNFNTRVATTFQSTHFPQYKISTAGATNAKSDDTFLDYSGKSGDLTPNVMFNITPTYSTDKFYAFMTYQYTGARWANAPNAFQLPAFSQIDLGIGYDVSKNISLSANINNLTNSFGVMTWGAPGGFPAVFNRSDFSAAQKEAQKNAVFPIGGTQPRAYFLTATYKF